MDSYNFRLDWEHWREQPNTLANRVKFLRLKLGRSITKIAASVEVRKATWVDVESGKRQPRKRSLHLIAYALGVRPSTLLTGNLADWVDLMRADYAIEPPLEMSR
jgi:transcriptional regulator with XRE-family HTH domain